MPRLPLLLTACLFAILPAAAVNAGDVTLPGTTRFDLAARPDGGAYRIFVVRPDRPAPAAGYPVLYLLDANAVIGTAADALRARQDLEPAVIVGIGYPTDQPFDIPRRFHDFTPPTAAANLPAQIAPGQRTGGQTALLDFIEQQLKPRIERELPIDRRRQTLFGHSLGGLFALHVLFTRPQAFQSYVAASPSIWWNRESILAEEAARPGISNGPARLLLTVGARETRNRMRDNTAAMAARLDASRDIEVSFALLDQAGHGASLPLSLLRGLDTVLSPLPRGLLEAPASGQ